MGRACRNPYFSSLPNSAFSDVISSLKSAIMGEFTPQNLANATNQHCVFFLSGEPVDQHAPWTGSRVRGGTEACECPWDKLEPRVLGKVQREGGAWKDTVGQSKESCTLS